VLPFKLSRAVFFAQTVIMSGLIAIVGRPNVGKSALFNRIVKKRIAIVHDQPGVTRDRVSVEAEWHGRPYTLVDTGGIGLLRREKSDDVIIKAAIEQVEIAIESANVIVLVVNVQEGVVPLDREVAEKLHRSGKPVLVAVNKVDTERAEKGADEFAALGFEKIFPVSAIHGEGIQNLMNEAVALLPQSAECGVRSAEFCASEAARFSFRIPNSALRSSWCLTRTS
jgi:GTPase